jgi:hypothetical protein
MQYPVALGGLAFHTFGLLLYWARLPRPGLRHTLLHHRSLSACIEDSTAHSLA